MISSIFSPIVSVGVQRSPVRVSSLGGSGLPVPALDLFFGSGTFIPNVGPLPTFSRASAATYVGYDGLIASATTNNPRIDYDPVTLACRGVLLEPAGTNQFGYSEDFTNVAWSKAAGAAISGNLDDPAGGTDAKYLTAISGTQPHFMYCASGFSCKTISVFAKAGTADFLALSFGAEPTNTGIDGGAFFDLLNGTVADEYANSASIEPAGNGFYRCSLTRATNATVVLIQPSTQSGQLVSWSAAGENIIIFGAQGEEKLTSYIRALSGSSVTRAADVCSISGSDFSGFYNETEGTWVVDYESATGGGVFSVNDNSSSNKIELNSSGATLATVGGTDVSTMTGGVSIAALVTAGNNYQLWSDGVQVDDTASVDNPAGLTQILLGALQDGSQSVTRIKRIRFYPVVLTAGQLAILTTPP